MNKTFHNRGFADYVYWQNQDRKTLNKINRLLQSIERDGAMNGIGKPEKLLNRDGYNRHIDEQNRLIYDIENDTIIIKACRGHYD
ncbi:MAG: Txe/YoeB family addiction module toxin [Selenomonadaceae bacterium]|nr:Txe/YoeB family addiction module toxin [Selenomonadaceae bacterium]